MRLCSYSNVTRLLKGRSLLGLLIIMLNLPYQFIIVNGTGDNVMHYDNDINIINYYNGLINRYKFIIIIIISANTNSPLAGQSIMD